MPKKILIALFLCTDHFNLYKIFQKGLESYSGCEVTTIVNKKFKYYAYSLLLCGAENSVIPEGYSHDGEEVGILISIIKWEENV